ncbi:DNA sulfur modification protein DndB [Sphingobacterium thalpophilum]|uniref:DGQHR domain n=1 Tax=Sphingobacterium thalpophilum TaxID=259 RepID=A0A4U9VT87_9SPHI|nr:DNA sulfur modification protein DndB [Sphingobacterium thalpophilum]VTR49129.1 DGQHR domain [Sphingobacterium thalpophilum]
MAGNKKIEGRNIQKRKYIELYGMFGDFDLPNKRVKVKYFSTIASGKDRKSDSFTLLSELKPMRERVKAKDIKDLSSLLQRNLDDFRVAYDLIPYLTEEKPNISFFPAILAVLLPNDYLKEGLDVAYPKRMEEENEQNRILNFENKWKVELFNIGGDVSNLGILSIDLKDIEVVVLDGQHRANAFRVASGAYSDKDSSVYPAFYNEVKVEGNLNADLPITLIWFEDEDGDIEPKYISRKLFVDVNNTAKRVSKSRKILLNDSEIASLITRFFYSELAKDKSFKYDELSLLHSEFDKDSDISVSTNNVFSITNPEFVYDIASWLTLGSRTFNQLHQYRSRDNFKGNIIEFGNIFNSKDFNGFDIEPVEESLVSKTVVLKNPHKMTAFENEYRKRLHIPLYYIFNNFILYKKHFEAICAIGDWYTDGMNTYQRSVWEEVFCGGEGLYYTFKNKETSRTKLNSTLHNYLTAIEEIEKRFKQERAKIYSESEKNVNSAYDSANTKAFQVGLVMALDLYKNGLPLIDKYEEFVGEINSLGEDNWLTILNVIRPALIKGTDPKQWPSYQKLIIRAIQKDYAYYSKDNFIDSPDGKIFVDLMKTSFNSWWDNQDEIEESELSTESIGLETIHKWAISSKEHVDDLFLSAGIMPIENVDTKKHGVIIIGDVVGKINPK